MTALPLNNDKIAALNDDIAAYNDDIAQYNDNIATYTYSNDGIAAFKGSVSRDLQPPVFFLIRTHLGP